MYSTADKPNTFKSAMAVSMAFHALVLLGILAAFTSSDPKLIMADGEGLVHVSLISSDTPGPGQVEAPVPEKKKARSEEPKSETALAPVAVKSRPEATQDRVRIEYASLMTGERSDTGSPVAVDLSVLAATGSGASHGAGGAGIPGQGKGEKLTMAIPRYSDNPRPSYPELARVKGYQGIVLLAAEVNAEGLVDDVRVKKTSGFTLLDRSAVDAVRKWKFEPGKRMGFPVAMWVDIPVRFVLGEDGQ